MSFSLKRVKEVVRPVEVEVEGEVLKMEYRPSAFTANYLDRVMDAGRGEGRVGRTLAEGTVNLIARWDMQLEEEGPVLPIEADVIAEEVPIFILTLIARAISEDMNVPKLKSAASDNSW